MTRKASLWLSLSLTLVLFISLTACGAPHVHEHEHAGDDVPVETSLAKDTDAPVAELPERVQNTWVGPFDSQTILLTEGVDPSVIDALGEDLEHYHRLFTPYESYEGMVNLDTVNDEARKGTAQLPEDINTVLRLAMEGAELSDGGFNPILGELVLLWRDVQDKINAGQIDTPLPTDEAIQKALKSADLSSIHYDPEAGTLSYDNPATELDLGGIAKGWAVEKLVQNAKERGAEHLLLSVGGNVRALGTKANGERWGVLIQDPFKGEMPDFPQLILRIEDEAVVTSGLYERFFIKDGVRYAHILNPHTGYPQDQYVSISILAKDSGVADMLATALFNMTVEDGAEMVAHYGCEALWIYEDGTYEMTEGFSERLVK